MRTSLAQQPEYEESNEGSDREIEADPRPAEEQRAKDRHRDSVGQTSSRVPIRYIRTGATITKQTTQDTTIGESVKYSQKLLDQQSTEHKREMQKMQESIERQIEAMEKLTSGGEILENENKQLRLELMEYRNERRQPNSDRQTRATATASD